MHPLRLHPLTPEAFAPYGQAFALDGGMPRDINDGTSRRLDLAAGLDLDRPGGRPVLAVFQVRAQLLAGPWRLLERHVHGSQTFVPLGPLRWIVLVASGGARPDMATLAAFEADGRHGITLRPGTWHHPLIALDAGTFLVLERAASPEDCEVVQLAEPVTLIPA